MQYKGIGLLHLALEQPVRTYHLSLARSVYISVVFLYIAHAKADVGTCEQQFPGKAFAVALLHEFSSHSH